MSDERIGTAEAAKILGCSTSAARKRMGIAKADTKIMSGLHGGVRLMFLKSDVEAYVHKTKTSRKKIGLRIDFRDAYCRWHDDTPCVSSDLGKKQTELHVAPKTDAVREDLTSAMESGELVLAAGRSYNSTKYKVIREETVFVLVNAGGMR